MYRDSIPVVRLVILNDDNSANEIHDFDSSPNVSIEFVILMVPVLKQQIVLGSLCYQSNGN